MKFKIPPKLAASRWRYIIGGLLIFVGTIALILPVGPGMLMIFAGMYLINKTWANKWLAKIKKRFSRKKVKHDNNNRASQKKTGSKES